MVACVLQAHAEWDILLGASTFSVIDQFLITLWLTLSGAGKCTQPKFAAKGSVFNRRVKSGKAVRLKDTDVGSRQA